MHPLIEDVADVTGGGLRGFSLAFFNCWFALCVCLKMAMMQLTNADSDLVAVDPNRDVANLCVPRWDGDNEPVSELHAKALPWHKPL